MESFVLDPADFWEFRAVTLDTAKVMAQAELLVGQAQARQRACLERLANKYPGFNPRAETFDYRTESYTITPHGGEGRDDRAAVP